jgi:ubiquinone/menaquinone biosynthesis C-methylase UbiE
LDQGAFPASELRPATTAVSFGAVAPYYDELMKSVPYQMWCSYYLLLLAHQCQHPKSVLDVCCGSGTMCELLTKEGFELSGVDLSEGMISQAIRKAKRKKLSIDYHVGDAASFELGRQFDAAFSFFDSLNNILEPRRLQDAFDRVYGHLQPGGSWIFDVNTAYAFEAQMFDQQNLRPNAKLRYKWTGTWNPQDRTIAVDMRFWYRDESFREIHRQRAYEREEIEAMLKKSGFVSIRAFHSYTLNPPRLRSDRVHYMALKPT